MKSHCGGVALTPFRFPHNHRERKRRRRTRAGAAVRTKQEHWTLSTRYAAITAALTDSGWRVPTAHSPSCHPFYQYFPPSDFVIGIFQYHSVLDELHSPDLWLFHKNYSTIIPTYIVVAIYVLAKAMCSFFRLFELYCLHNLACWSAVNCSYR